MRIKNYNNIYQISFLAYVFPINCYIYEETDSLTLIDIGTNFFCRPLLQLSHKLNKPITKIVITHPHMDHVAGLDSIVSALPGVRIYISERDLALLKGDLSIHSYEENDTIKGGFTKLQTLPDQFVKDGDYIGSLKVISTPGHTPGSISLYDEKDAAIIAGDALQVKGGLSVAGDKRILFPFPALATWSLKRAIESAKLIQSLELSLLATGHGDMIKDPKEKLSKAIQRAEARLKNEKSKNQ